MKQILYITVLVILNFSCTKEKKDIYIKTIETGAKYRINDIYFLNKDKGFAVGGDKYFEGNIIETKDGGNTWSIVENSRISSHSEVKLQTLHSIDFLNDSTGQIVGFGGKVLRTEDGGKTWISILNGSWSHFIQIKMFSLQKTLIVSKGALFKSSEFWYNYDIEDFSFTLSDIEITANNTAYLVGYGFVKKSIDNMQTWKTLNIKGDFFYDIDFVNNNTGFMCGWQGGIYKTVDAGETWQKLHPVNSAFSKRYHFENLDFIDENTGVVCAYNGEILYTKNAGKTWQKIKIDNKTDFHSIYFYDKNTVFVGGSKGEIFEIKL